jgi:hypothetical protein
VPLRRAEGADTRLAAETDVSCQLLRRRESLDYLHSARRCSEWLLNDSIQIIEAFVERERDFSRMIRDSA